MVVIEVQRRVQQVDTDELAERARILRELLHVENSDIDSRHKSEHNSAASAVLDVVVALNLVLGVEVEQGTFTFPDEVREHFISLLVEALILKLAVLELHVV